MLDCRHDSAKTKEGADENDSQTMLSISKSKVARKKVFLGGFFGKYAKCLPGLIITK